jgi:hypothetical protein
MLDVVQFEDRACHVLAVGACRNYSVCSGNPTIVMSELPSGSFSSSDKIR